MGQPANVLVVEDENIIAMDIKTTLTNLGYRVPAVAASGEEALEQVAAFDPDLVLMDIHLRGGMDGVQAAEVIRERFDIPLVYLTAYADPRTLERTRLTEPYGYVLKPFEERELHVVIEMALYRHQMARKLKESERWLAATLRSIGDGVIAVDGDWRVRFMNPVAENLTGWKIDAALGRDLAEVLHVTISAPPRPLPTGEHPGGGIAQGVLYTLDGREIAVEESSTTIRNDEGRVVGSVVAVRDISTRGSALGESVASGAVDINDGPVQDISAAVSQLQSLVPLLAGNLAAEKGARQVIARLERAQKSVEPLVAIASAIRASR